MATIRYRGLDKPPSLPLDVGSSLPPPIRLNSLFQYLIQLGAYLLKVGDVVNNILRGKLNCEGTFTVAHDAATTTLSDPNIGGNSSILVMPTTAHAATELATLYFDTFIKGGCTAHHANNAQTDRVFSYVVIG